MILSKLSELNIGDMVIIQNYTAVLMGIEDYNNDSNLTYEFCIEGGGLSLTESDIDTPVDKIDSTHPRYKQNLVDFAILLSKTMSLFKNDK